MTKLMTSPVLAALAEAKWRAAPMFARWCALQDVRACPASPAMVAQFIADCASLGIERLWPAVQQISAEHTSLGLADPTLGSPAATALAAIAAIAPPRSWPDDHKRRFAALPHDLQLYIAAHEAQREKALRRAQNEAARARRQLAAVQHSPTTQKGMEPDDNGPQTDPHRLA